MIEEKSFDEKLVEYLEQIRVIEEAQELSKGEVAI